MMEFSSLSSSGSSKRVKTPNGGNISISVSCLVDGCNSDLSQCREYHRRHKVCELHSKTPKVTIGGREQRFCQQCSRFHSLVEFDEGKRSCRKRLDGHNRRRRKAQLDSMSRTSGMFLSSQQGTTILSFNNPQIHPSAMVSSSWVGVVKPENDTILFDNQPPMNYIDRHNLFPESSSAHRYKGGVNQFQLFQSMDRVSNTNRAGESNCAHSLLSSPLLAQTREIMQPPIPIVHSNLQCGGFGQYASFAQEMDNEAILSDSNGDNHSNTTFHFQGMFHNGRDGSTANGDHQTLSLRWD